MMGTFHRPASRPYFLVTSSAEAEEAEGEEDEDGFSNSWVFSLRALTLKRFKLAGGGEKDERHWRSLTLSCPSHNQEEDESEGTCNAVVIIATRPKIFYLSKHPFVLPSVNSPNKFKDFNFDSNWDQLYRKLLHSLYIFPPQSLFFSGITSTFPIFSLFVQPGRLWHVAFFFCLFVSSDIISDGLSLNSHVTSDFVMCCWVRGAVVLIHFLLDFNNLFRLKVIRIENSKLNLDSKIMKRLDKRKLYFVIYNISIFCTKIS